jgi:hypothetical protein
MDGLAVASIASSLAGTLPADGTQRFNPVADIKADYARGINGGFDIRGCARRHAPYVKIRERNPSSILCVISLARSSILRRALTLSRSADALEAIRVRGTRTITAGHGARRHRRW